MRPFSLLGAAAILTLATGQAHAASGYVGVAYIDAEADIGGFEVEDDGWGVEGAAAFVASPGVGVQLGAVVADSDASDTGFSVNGHLNLRDSRRLIGGFLGIGEVADDTFWTIGAEGELYMLNFTLAGAFGYADFDDSGSDAWSVDGEARFFPIEDLRLEGELGFANIDAGFGDDDVFTIGASAEYQFDAVPISVFAGYSHDEFDSADLSADIFTIGGRWNFGGTLRMRDLTGVSLPGLSRFTGALGD